MGQLAVTPIQPGWPPASPCCLRCHRKPCNIAPGLPGVILSMTLVMMTAPGVARGSGRGAVGSLPATPVKSLELMIGEPAACVLVGLTPTIVTLAPARVVFDVPLNGGWRAPTHNSRLRNSPFTILV